MPPKKRDKEPEGSKAPRTDQVQADHELFLQAFESKCRPECCYFLSSEPLLPFAAKITCQETYVNDFPRVSTTARKSRLIRPPLSYRLPVHSFFFFFFSSQTPVIQRSNFVFVCLFLVLFLSSFFSCRLFCRFCKNEMDAFSLVISLLSFFCILYLFTCLELFVKYVKL